MSEKIDTGIIDLASKNFYLKKLTLNHATEEYVGWLNDKEVNEFLEVRYSVQDLSSVKDFIRNSESDNSRYMFGIFSKETNKHIGNGSVLMINYAHQTFDIGYLIGNKSFWGSSAGFEACLLLLSFGFNILGLRKCFSGVYSNHVKSRFMMRKIGFIHEATLKDHLIFDGNPVDEVYYTMDRNQWSDIKERDMVKSHLL
jgi:ribosomal-protein-alanine N-acetyltransferase